MADLFDMKEIYSELMQLFICYTADTLYKKTLWEKYYQPKKANLPRQTSETHIPNQAGTTN